MAGVPILIEVQEAKDASICGRVAQALLQNKIQPVGYALNLKELTDILGSMNEHDLKPCIFIVNTFKAKEIIPSLDKLMGETPAVYLRRGLYAGQSGLMDHLVPDVSKLNTMAVIKSMTPRLTSVWTYGAKNAEQVAQKIIACTLNFMKDGNFRHYEIANQVSGTGR